MTLSGYINTFLLLAVLSIHPTVTSAEYPAVKSSLNSSIFPATPDNNSLLRHYQALKNKYRKELASLRNQGDLQGEANLYCLLGDLENVTGEFRKAEAAYDAYRKAESLYEKTDNNLGLGRVWYGRGEMERKRNQYNDAKKAYEKAKLYYQRANSYQGQAAVQLTLGHIKRNTAEKFDDLKEAQSFYKSAKNLYEMAESRVGEANVFCAFGELECSLGNYAESEKAYDQAASLYRKKNNELGLANVLMGQGDLARVRNDNSQALVFYKQAAGHYKTIQDDLGQANALTGLAHVNRKFPAPYHFGKSSNHYGNALNLYTTLEDTLGMANVLAGQGDLETLQGNHEKAETNYLSAKRYYEDLGDKLGQAHVALGLGRLEAIQNKTDSALKRYGQAEYIYRIFKNLLGLANALTERGHLQSMLGETEVDRILSLNTYDEAKRLYSDLGSRLGEAHVLCGIGWLKKGSGDLEGAKTAFKEARSLYEQLENYQGKDATDQFLKEIESKIKEQLAREVSPGTPIITNPPSEEVQDQVPSLIKADKTHLVETVQKIWCELRRSIKGMLNACKNIFYSVCEYLLRNLDWLFSGGMISIMGTLLVILRNNKK